VKPRGPLFAAALLAPAHAWAASSPTVLDLGTGAPRQLLGTTLGLARGFFVFALILSLVLEAFGRAPYAPREYGACVFRALVVLVLLSFYSTLFGTVVNLTEDVAARVAPAQAWTDFSKRAQEEFSRLFERRSEADEHAAKVGKTEGWSDAVADGASIAGGVMGGFVFDSIVATLVLVGEAAHWVIGMLGRVLAVVFYVLGPLALVFSIPRASGLGLRWFRGFIAYCCWPILSGLILSITLAVGVQGLALDGASSAFGSVATALLLVATAVMTPVLASSILGGGGSNLASAGLDALSQRARSVAAIPAARLSKPSDE
jgi:hypothetical protein